MKIVKVLGREIYDACGWPTVECEIMLEDGSFVNASVPAGVSRGSHEAFELRDGGQRLMGKGVTQAIDNIENIICPLLIGKEPDIISLDIAMIEADGTPDKSKIGGNAMLAASIAVLRAQAFLENIDPYELIAYLCDYNSVTLPFAMFNMIGGGKHANNNSYIQEIMAMPVGPQSFRECLEAAVTLHQILGKLLLDEGKDPSIGIEGAYNARFSEETEAFDMLMKAIEKAEKITGSKYLIAIDMAATTFFDKKTNKYNWHGNKISASELIGFYEQLVQKYPIFSIEDGLNEFDYNGWAELHRALSEKVQIIGDDLLVSNPQKIANAVDQGLITGTIIKPNQVGTVTETLQAIKFCKEHDITAIVSHRSHETNDTFIIDVVVGTSAGYIKAGGPTRGEHLAKYNELLRIEDVLMLTLMNA
jgi:enolase